MKLKNRLQNDQASAKPAEKQFLKFFVNDFIDRAETWHLGTPFER